MPVMEISIIPVGTNKTSISGYVAKCDQILMKEKGIKAQLTAMGTIIESDSIEKLFRLAEKMHRTALNHSVKRVITNITLDERLDKDTSIEKRIESVKKKLF